MNYDIYIDGFIGKSDFFTEGFSLSTLREKLNSAPADTKEVTIHINSGGGSVTEGFAIYDALIALDKKVNTVVEGLCGSIATIIAQAGKKGIRSMHPNSEYFIHNPYWTPDAPTPMEAADLATLTEDLQKNEDKIANFYADVTGQNLDFIKEKMKAQTSFSADEAKQFGFVDTVIESQIKAYQKHVITANGNEYRFAAFIDTKQKQSNMDILKTLNEFESKLTAKFESLIKKTIKAEMVKTSEGVDVFYNTPLEVGSSVYADEAMTQPAPDGVHTIGDKKYSVKSGKVESVEEPTAAADALKAEVESLKNQLLEKETALAQVTNDNAALKAEVEGVKAISEEVKTEFQNFKAQFVTGNGELKPEFQSFKDNGGQAKESLVDAIMRMRGIEKKSS